MDRGNGEVRQEAEFGERVTPYPDIERIDVEAAAERLGQPDTVFVDVRPPQAHAASHIQGARSMPLIELPRRLRELPRDAELVFY